MEFAYLPLMQPHASVFCTAEGGSDLACKVVSFIEADLVSCRRVKAMIGVNTVSTAGFPCHRELRAAFLIAQVSLLFACQLTLPAKRDSSRKPADACANNSDIHAVCTHVDCVKMMLDFEDKSRSHLSPERFQQVALRLRQPPAASGGEIQTLYSAPDEAV